MSKSPDKYNTDQFWHWTSLSDHINYGKNKILYRLINVKMFAQIILHSFAHGDVEIQTNKTLTKFDGWPFLKYDF